MTYVCVYMYRYIYILSNKRQKKLLAIVIKKSELKEKLFHKHCCSEVHQGIENWSVTLIDQVEYLDSRRTESDKQVKHLGTK